MKIKLEKSNGEPLFKTITPRTRLKFSICVIIANFLMGVIGILLGTDLTALGVFLAMANAPLYAYVLGQSFSPTKIPDTYFNQPHNGSGGLNNKLGDINEIDNSDKIEMQKPDDYNNQNFPQSEKNIPITTKPESEIG
jgi:hypothetical protein